MNMEKQIKGKSYVLFLLLLDALKHTNREYPRTKDELIQDVSSAWQEHFPDEPPAQLSKSSVGRYIDALNTSGFYHIATSKNKKEGYYCDKFDFEAAEFSLIAQALYRSVTISTTETNAIIKKFLHRTDSLGEDYLDIMIKQMERRAPRRKPTRHTLPIIRAILDAIWKQKKLKFTYYTHQDRDMANMQKRLDSATGKTKKYVVSPYYLVWNMDECYLIAHCAAHDTKKDKHHLSHFKVSLIADQFQLTYDAALSISEMEEYKRYSLKRTIPEYKAVNEYKKKASTKEEKQLISNRSALVTFSLDRYMRENIFMFHNDTAPIDMRFFFRESFQGQFLAQFNLDSNMLHVYPTNRTFPDGETALNAYVTVQENEGLYRWLMLQGDNVIVVEPASVRAELKKRMQTALNTIIDYEQHPLEPVDPEKLKADKQKERTVEMFDDMLRIPS